MCGLDQHRQLPVGCLFVKLLLGGMDVRLYVNEFNREAAYCLASLTEGFWPSFTLIYGPGGIGKTTLLYYLRQRVSALQTCRYTNGERYAREYSTVAQLGQLAQFRERYRRVDVLLFDDIHLLAGKRRSIEEFYHTCEHLVAQGGKIVATLRAGAPELGFLGERLASRLRGGMVVPVLLPRTAELEGFAWHYIRDRKLVVEEELIPELAASVHSLSEMQQTFHAFLRFAAETDDALTLACFRRYLAARGLAEKNAAIPANIVRVTAEVCGVPMADILSGRQSSRLNQAKRLAMYALRNLAPLSYAEIGRFFCRQHSSVIRACRQVQAELVEDEQIRERWRKICQVFGL